MQPKRQKGRGLQTVTSELAAIIDQCLLVKIAIKKSIEINHLLDEADIEFKGHIHKEIFIWRIASLRHAGIVLFTESRHNECVQHFLSLKPRYFKSQKVAK